MELKELTEALKRASIAYYNGTPIMDDHEYDKLEKEYQNITGKYFSIIEQGTGEKFKHEWKGTSYRALSLDKTKDVNLIQRKFAGFRSLGGNSDEAVVMWKEDGSTLQLYYENNPETNNLVLAYAVTRGTDGEEGDIVSHNAMFIDDIPKSIKSDGSIDYLIVRGEALMSYEEFERIKDEVENKDVANPRNLATGTIGMKNPEDGVMKRKISFRAFTLVAAVSADGEDLRPATFNDRLDIMAKLGFKVVEHKLASIADLIDVMAEFEASASDYEFPVDGEVIAYNDAVWAEKQPGTEHNPFIAVGYALKWADEEKETSLENIEWNTTRTGLINPVAVFKPVDLEGTTVDRATLHNLSEIEKKLGRPYKGQKLVVYKANKIIPAVASGEKGESDRYFEIPKYCPYCSSLTKIEVSESGTKSLYCSNESCSGRHLDGITHFASKAGLNITGLSKAKINFLLQTRIIYSAADLFTLKEENLLAHLDGEKGWGEKSIHNLIESINKAKNCDFISFVAALGIPGIQKGQAKVLKKHLENIYSEYETNCIAFMKEHDIRYNFASDGVVPYSLFNMLLYLNTIGYDFTQVEKFGEVNSNNISNWLNEHFYVSVHTASDDIIELTDEERLLRAVSFTDVPVSSDRSAGTLSGLTFVITGTLNHFDNRDALKELIESKDGKVSGSVSKSTTALINNDITSTSGKNKKAKELGVEIVSEEDFLNRFDLL